MRTIICFDVSSPRRRYRVVKLLKDHAVRVQKSVFEAVNLEPATYRRLRSKLEGAIDPRTDSLRYYRVCETCSGKIEHTGVGPGPIDPPDDVTLL